MLQGIAWVVNIVYCEPRISATYNVFVYFYSQTHLHRNTPREIQMVLIFQSLQ